MTHRSAGWSRSWHVFVLVSLVLGMVLVAPTRHAEDQGDQHKHVPAAAPSSAAMGHVHTPSR